MFWIRKFLLSVCIILSILGILFLVNENTEQNHLDELPLTLIDNHVIINNNHITSSLDDNDNVGINRSQWYDLSQIYVPYGKEYCLNSSKYSQWRYLSISGLYNTGTNALYKLLRDNCYGSYVLWKSLDILKRGEKFDPPIYHRLTNLSHLRDYHNYKNMKDIENIFYYNDNSDNISILRDKASMAFESVMWQAIYGKHNMRPSYKDLSWIVEYFDENKQYSRALNIVVIKDILTWIQSICKTNYYVRLKNHHSVCVKWDQIVNNLTLITQETPIATTTKLAGIEKINVAGENGKISETIFHSNNWDSIIDFYNFWYNSWINDSSTIAKSNPQRGYSYKDNANIGLKNWQNYTLNGTISYSHPIVGKNKKCVNNKAPHNDLLLTPQEYKTMLKTGHQILKAIKVPVIFVRFEDVLFSPGTVVNYLCDCVGGLVRKNIHIAQDKSKKHGKSRTRQEALKVYSNVNYRFDRFDDENLKFIKQHVDQSLLHDFGYYF